jgi:hypothetical protein
MSSMQTAQAGSPPRSGGAGTSTVAGASGAAGSEMPEAGTAGSASGEDSTCMKGAVKASEVVFLGESFIALSGAIPRFTTQLARDAGTIAMGDSYRSYALSGTQLTTGEIPMQYDKAKGEGPVKVVLMDGAGNDLLLGNRCQTGFDASCMEIVSVVDKLFKRMKQDGIKDVVYFFYPDPMGIGAQIKTAMDMLRPEMKKFCDGTTDVRCIWVDQRESWEGHYDTYTSDGIHPTDAGAMASAKQIWDAMVANCIAQ